MLALPMNIDYGLDNGLFPTACPGPSDASGCLFFDDNFFCYCANATCRRFSYSIQTQSFSPILFEMSKVGCRDVVSSAPKAGEEAIAATLCQFWPCCVSFKCIFLCHVIMHCMVACITEDQVIPGNAIKPTMQTHTVTVCKLATRESRQSPKLSMFQRLNKGQICVRAAKSGRSFLR